MNFTGINKKWGTVILHTAVWIIIFSLPFLLNSNHNDRFKNPDSAGFFYLNALTGLFWVLLFYLNAFVLTSRLL